MSKYFKRYEDIMPVLHYQDDVSYIRTEVESKYGTLDCSDSKLEDLWRNYSDDAWCAGFMSPNEELIESFVDWLEEQEWE